MPFFSLSLSFSFLPLQSIQLQCHFLKSEIVTTLINPKGLAQSFILTVQYILHVLVYSSSHDPFFSFWPKLHVNTNLHIPKSSTFFDTHVKTYFLQLILICYLTIGSKARAPSQSYFKTIDDNRSSKKKSYSHTYNKKKKRGLNCRRGHIFEWLLHWIQRRVA